MGYNVPTSERAEAPNVDGQELWAPGTEFLLWRWVTGFGRGKVTELGA